MSAKLKVCIATDYLYPGGTLTVTQFTYSSLIKAGAEPTILFTKRQGVTGLLAGWLRGGLMPSEETQLGMKGLGVDTIGWIDALRNVVPARSLSRELEKYDAFIVVGGGCLVGLLFALNKKPYVCWMGTLINDELKAMRPPWPRTLEGKAKRAIHEVTLPFVLAEEKHVLSKARRIATHSSYTARKVAALCPGSRDRISVLPCAVDTHAFQPGSGGPRLVDGKYIVLVGRLNDPRKNVNLLLRAFRQVRHSGLGVSLVLVGRQPMDGSLQRACAGLGILDAVVFVGESSMSELASYYRDAEMLVLSSTQEGFGLVVIEAMACGIPVVSTRCGGPEDIIDDGESGFLVPSGDEHLLAEAIIRLLRDSDLRRDMGQKARETVRQRFSREVIERPLLELCGQMA